MNKNLVEHLYLLRNEKFFTIFKREEAKVPDSNTGNNGIVSEGSQQFSVSMDRMLEQVKGSDDFALNLKVILRKTLGDCYCVKSNAINVFWKITFISESLACVELSVSGDFLEKFLAEYKLPVAVKLWFELQLADEMITVESGNIHPTLLIERNSTGDQGTSIFKDTLEKKTEKPIPTDQPLVANIRIRISANRTVALKGLPSKRKIGQLILENQVESDFAIISEDDIRFECNKVFLAGNSNAWAGMLQMNCKETQEKAIKLKMSAKGVNALLKFIYYVNLDDPKQTPSIALELLEIGHQYDILGLEKAMRSLFLEQTNEWLDMDTALLLYLRTLKVDGYEDLKWKALQAFKSKPSELTGSAVFDKLMKDGSEEVKELIAICLQIK